LRVFWHKTNINQIVSCFLLLMIDFCLGYNKKAPN
jgi:hypothetical protein